MTPYGHAAPLIWCCIFISFRSLLSDYFHADGWRCRHFRRRFDCRFICALQMLRYSVTLFHISRCRRWCYCRCHAGAPAAIFWCRLMMIVIFARYAVSFDCIDAAFLLLIFILPLYASILIAAMLTISADFRRHAADVLMPFMILFAAAVTLFRRFAIRYYSLSAISPLLFSLRRYDAAFAIADDVTPMHAFLSLCCHDAFSSRYDYLLIHAADSALICHVKRYALAPLRYYAICWLRLMAASLRCRYAVFEAADSDMIYADKPRHFLHKAIDYHVMPIRH